MVDFGTEVKIELLKKDMTQRELAKCVSEKTGLYIDDALISKVLSGVNNNEKIVGAIKEILELA